MRAVKDRLKMVSVDLFGAGFPQHAKWGLLKRGAEAIKGTPAEGAAAWVGGLCTSLYAKVKRRLVMTCASSYLYADLYMKILGL